jgi:hypothetical protein
MPIRESEISQWEDIVEARRPNGKGIFIYIPTLKVRHCPRSVSASPFERVEPPERGRDDVAGSLEFCKYVDSTIGEPLECLSGYIIPV